MKLFSYIVCIILVFNLSAAAQQVNIPKIAEKKSAEESSFEKRMRVIEDMKNSFYYQPEELDSKTVFRIIGGAALVGFLASVTIFKQDLFGTVPLTLLAAGIIFFILSV